MSGCPANCQAMWVRARSWETSFSNNSGVGCWSLRFGNQGRRACHAAIRKSFIVSAQTSSIPFKNQQKVIVVGAGAAGLACSRELRNEGHEVKVFEQAPDLGGTWVLDRSANIGSPLSHTGGKEEIHSSMYESLRTNLPRELMSFTDFPFLPEVMGGWSVDSRRYPGHEEVRNYLEAFADEFNLRSMVEFNARVTEIKPNQETADHPVQWSAVIQTNGKEQTEIFDAVVVCNGHYTKPTMLMLPGSENFPGEQIHSHVYRNPSHFKDKTVVVLGASHSGQDLSRDIASVAKKVYLCGKPTKDAKWLEGPQNLGLDGNVTKKPWIEKLGENGDIWFQDGSCLSEADVVLFCTGYKYSFPFLSSIKLLKAEGKKVSPLYQHIFEPTLAPSLSFVGIPFNIVPFPLFQYQSKFIARVLSGRCNLPSKGNMEQVIKNADKASEEEGRLSRHFHEMGHKQFPYMRWLQKECGSDVVELSSWREGMFTETSRIKRAFPETYRDIWEDEDLIANALEEFKSLRTHAH